MDREEVLKLAGGRVWTGRQAQQNGLVDALGTLADAVADAKAQAGLPADEEVELLLKPSPANFLDQMLGLETDVASRLTGRIVEPLQELAPGMKRGIHQLEQLQRLFREPAVCILPYEVEIR